MAEAERYDCFLAHVEADAEEVEAIARALTDDGLSVFFGAWNLVPGDPRLDAFEAALSQACSAAVFVSEHGIEGWQREHMRVAFEKRRAEPAFRIIPVLLGHGVTKASLRGTTLATISEARVQGREDEVGIRSLIRGIRGRPIVWPPFHRPPGEGVPWRRTRNAILSFVVTFVALHSLIGRDLGAYIVYALFGFGVAWLGWTWTPVR